MITDLDGAIEQYRLGKVANSLQWQWDDVQDSLELIRGRLHNTVITDWQTANEIHGTLPEVMEQMRTGFGQWSTTMSHNIVWIRKALLAGEQKG